MSSRPFPPHVVQRRFLAHGGHGHDWPLQEQEEIEEDARRDAFRAVGDELREAEETSNVRTGLEDAERVVNRDMRRTYMLGRQPTVLMDDAYVMRMAIAALSPRGNKLTVAGTSIRRRKLDNVLRRHTQLCASNPTIAHSQLAASTSRSGRSALRLRRSCRHGGEAP